MTGTIDTGQLDQVGTLTARDHHAIQCVEQHRELVGLPGWAVRWRGALLMGRDRASEQAPGPGVRHRARGRLPVAVWRRVGRGRARRTRPQGTL